MNSPNETPNTLGDALPKECARVRELQAQYLAIGLGGLFGYLAMANSLKAADQAMIEGDLPAMIAAYQDLQTWTD
jgi:hypothetical protein